MAGRSPIDWEALERRATKYLSGAERNLGEVMISSAEAVACLVCDDRILPLVSGRQLVDSGPVSSYAVDRSTLRGIVEGAQWLIDHRPDGVTIADTRSTNGSVILRRDQRELASRPLIELNTIPGVQRLGWDGSALHEDPAALTNGDALINAYRIFLYVARDPGA